MKKLLIVLTAALLTVSLCACGGNNGGTTASTASETSTASVSADVELDLQAALAKVKTDITFPGDTIDFTAKRIKSTLGIEEGQMDDFSGLFCSDGVTQDQVIYIKAKTNDDVTFIQGKLKDHLDAIYNVIKNYTPEQADMIQKATVDTNGMYVSLVISDKADDIKKIYSESVKS